MTYFQLYKNTEKTLNDSKIENASFVALQLILNSFNITNTKYLLNKNENADEKGTVDLLMKIGKVVSGEPLQYVLGKWEFMGLDFFVGRGVLIPRPETELLVEKAIELIKNKKNPVIFDLCSGSGCIAISLAKNLPTAKIYAVEKSDTAIEYLLKNIKYNSIQNIIVINYDIFDGFDKVFFENPDLIVSNPPYIKTDDIPTLEPIVKKEPCMALDGGADGYDFYRCIVQKWVNCINKSGCIAVECGDGQSSEILKMFDNNFEKTTYFNDLSGIDRVVIGKNKK